MNTPVMLMSSETTFMNRRLRVRLTLKQWLRVGLLDGIIATTIGVNATGHAGDASPAIFGQPGTKCLILYPPKFVKIVIKLPPELMHTVQPAFAVQARRRDSPRESDSPYFA